MADGQVVFEITGDPKNINQTVKQVTNNIQAESKKWDQAAGQATGQIEKSFASMAGNIIGKLTAAGIGTVLLKWGSDAVQLASDLQEVQNVVDTVFGSNSNQIETWAKNAGTQFGLTELQAKKFTSTLGAMMKSSGLAGDEIVTMSTDLAGLAADMASFYNMDFETAFEKIRSGISGETMPLKQLGINMSVANLEAFALAQGLNKTFSEMSQGEQTMLRYQYLMQAASDAQGDFAKTADSFENAKRRITTALDTISATVGGFILTAIDPLVSGLASVLENITASDDQETLFDKVASIELDANTKIADINRVAATAQNLIDKLEFIAGTDAGEAVKKIAVGANKLDASSPGTWQAILTSLKDIDGLQNIFSESSAAGNIESLANALSGSEVDTTKAEAWKTFLGALADNADAVSSMTGKSVEETVSWLTQMADAVNKIDANDADAWNNLLTTLVQGFSADTPEGQQFLESMATQFLALGSDSDVATRGLQALGFSSEQISDKQSEWLKTCKELVQTIPGLSGVVNTETGAIEGGIGALNEYVKEWKASQEKLIYWKAYYAKVAAQQDAQNALYSMEIEAGGAEMAIKRQMEKLDNLREELGIGGEDYEMVIKTNAVGGQGVLTAAEKQWNDEVYKLGQLRNKAAIAEDKYTEAVKQNSEVIEQNANEHDYLVERFGELTEAEINAGDAAEDAAESMSLLKRAQAGDAEAVTELTDAYKNASEALKAVADYYDQVRKSTEQAVSSTIKGFSEVRKAGDSLRSTSNELAGEETEVLNKFSDVWNKWGSDNAALKSMQEFKEAGGNLTATELEAYEALVKVRNAQKEVNESLNQYKPETMIRNLEQQIAYMDEYMQNLDQLKEWGVSQELLAQLSDGSTESAEYLSALVQGGEKAAQSVGEKYDELAKKKEEFASNLTDTKLTADQAYQDLVDAAASALEDLNLYDEAKGALADTVQGIADGVEEELPAVHSAVQAIIDELNRLSGFGINYDFDAGGNIEILFGDVEHFASGTDWIPRNNFPAFLDYGEAVLTAEENKIWQMFKNGQYSGIDYETIGNLMRDNVQAGGNVYLDGRAVGNVISDQQGRSFRQLQRSGWQG